MLDSMAPILCIAEGVGISPAFGIDLHRYVPKGGAMIFGLYFPEGYEIIINANAAHFDEECEVDHKPTNPNLTFSRFWPGRRGLRP